MKTIIIGAGPAGVTVAETLRQYDEKMEIIMICREPFPPYAPPAMIEYFMTGEEAHFWRWKDIPKRLDLDYRPETRVSKVIPKEQMIRLVDGEILEYDNLVIATGSRLYTTISGFEKTGIYNFKALSPAMKLVKEVREDRAKNALIIGAGFIGVEISLLLNHFGIEVTIVEMADRIMPGMLDTETSEIALGLIQEHGINVQLNTKAIAFHGGSRAEALELESGEVMNADIFVAATGVKPIVGFLEGSGIEINWGVPVDEYLRTNFPKIYAAGDVIETVDRITGDRSVQPIFPNAVTQGRVVAFNLLGWNIPYEGADRMNSLKHLGLPIIAAGRAEGEELRFRRGSTLRKLYLHDNRINGFQLAGDIKSAGIYRTLMNKRVDVSSMKDLLLEPGFGMGYIPDQNLYWRPGIIPVP
ncbi:MAG: NAD(P)/FAD-dependent oxidoreductase [bacterium]